ncbi:MULTISPECIES: tetratricopeptide repeat protein [Leptospira]|uniref:Tetratricopeptide repeat protein n=2 Tax=Leptospira TaxID=171 RepID=A0ABT3LZZ2_9LEPT|nr:MULTISPECIES: tetratricopeptide repeat protein [Leptospira]MBL0953270.1 tetratricopeptide repeat protein [Leptospira sp.]MCW7463300.1 tetratricopeptide repeat protein [Leptospira limi]MCW7503399.1 tetratricopeptide repeat protein [Leptospira paudalimensis]
MSRVIVSLAGLLFIVAGLSTAYYQTNISAKEDQSQLVLEKIAEGEEYLKQTNPHSKEKAIVIFSELAGKQGLEKYEFQIKYNQARALEKNSDFYPALDIYKDLKKNSNWKQEDRDKLSYSLGNLLLKIGNEPEGKAHLESVLQSSSDNKLRSKTFMALADHYYKIGQYETARKNYVLSLQEDPNHTESRIGWGRTLRKLGKDWASFDVFDEYIETQDGLAGADEKVVGEYKDSVFKEAKDNYTKKQYAKSIELFQKSLTVNPSPKKEEEALYYIALAYDAIGKQTESLTYINKVLNNSDYSLDQASLYKKGTIYFRQGKFEKAAGIFQTIVDKYPKNQITDKAIAWKKESLDQFTDHNDLEDSDVSSDSNSNKPNSYSGKPDSGNDLEF